MKSQHSGVYYLKAYDKWQANVCHDGKRYYLGRYATREQACAAVEAKRVALRSSETWDHVADLMLPGNQLYMPKPWDHVAGLLPTVQQAIDQRLTLDEALLYLSGLTPDDT